MWYMIVCDYKSEIEWKMRYLWCVCTVSVCLRIIIVSEKFHAAVSKPERVCGFLVVGPGEWSEEGGPLGCNQNWRSNNTSMQWWSPKICHWHSWFEWVGHSPVSHAHKSSICHNLPTHHPEKLINSILVQTSTPKLNCNMSSSLLCSILQDLTLILSHMLYYISGRPSIT